ncbi:MAG: CPBP family intramembrane metalloprotease, partial [Gemmatimonadales bacterium]|nr:CPBP family intramembrane metalloprotease [Candidatus Palauibacter ramosifaciens]
YVSMITFIDIAVSGVLAPIKEEISERGILYAALRKKGKVIAYFLSVFWFVFLHVPSYSNLFFNGIIGLTLHHFILIILTGIITAYIYESTGKLILCVIFHCAINATLTLSAFLYYLIT